MNFDRATLNFLNEFPEKVRQEGEALQKDGCVTQIFGNHHFVQGRVEVDRGQVFQTTLTLNDNKWVGTSTSSRGNECSSLVATMLERIDRGDDLPEAPNEVGQKSLPEILEEGLGRELTPSEDGFLNKLERRFRRYMIEKKLFDHDLVRLNPKWEVASYDPLRLWPVPPEDIVEFWNYVAYAFDKKGLRIPEFLRPVTDLDAVRQKLQSWEDERKIGEWEDRMGELNAEAPPQLPVPGEFRLLIKPSEAVLQWKEEGASGFASVGSEVELARLLELHDLGALVLEEESALLWMHFLAHRQQTGADEVRLESQENGRFLNRLFLQKELRNLMVTLDESPFAFVEEPLRWQCVDADKAAMEAGLAEAGAGIELMTASGERVPYTLRLLPGAESLYLADDTVFRGARFWGEETEVLPRYEIPEMVLASESGVEFLGRIDAELPPSLKDRVRDETMHVTVRAELAQKISSADSEHVLLDISASDAAGRRREIYDRDGWRVDQRGDSEDDTIFRFNRRILYRMPVILERLNVSWEASRDKFKARVSKQFPEKFAEWARNLPAEVTLELDENLQSLLADPVKASLKFEVVNEEIDWFDLKIVLKVEGHDLSQEEIRALVAARGSFVRMKQGGWLRLELDMEEEQMQAVSRLGLDPFDLSEESHRMHALQLADSRAKEVFDPRAWNRICERSDQVTLRVRPNVPSLVTADLRSYQVEGFHFLAYLSANNFGGILADDMGLGKTVQSLTWLAWLRAKVESGTRPLPSLVVCPKSVLDVWAGEVDKFAPSLKVQVLRSKEELDVDALKNDIDILVLNYSQLRVNAEHLRGIEWLAVILDEGQQIKNPDSKAARASRELKANNRLVLTGTPIENRLLDVWSLMAFAMPGVLGDRKYFRDRFDRRKDNAAQTRLSARLRPFMLRRTKGQVAMDLPPRTEEDVLCKLEDVQAELYLEELGRVQQALLGFKDEADVRKNNFVVLQGLMRLRQICCHPGLIDPKHVDVESAKLNALFYLLDQLREEGHKVLVFSQFVKMLDIIKGRLEDEDRPFSYLTGQTTDRSGEIERFQTSTDPNVFLLSLKAGGSGLNLTSASYVILYDPWWNPAVENQAIDRTHRIGQTNPVMAYRLIMRDSVEEKIRRLQNQKSQMAGNVLGEEGFTRNLEMKDLQYLFSEDPDMEMTPEERKKAKRKPVGV